MKTTPAPADLQRWSDELARNPASLAFLPLARAYRRQGRLDLAMSLCHRGLEQNPEHVEGHALLARLYLENGDRARAADEWSTILRLEPGNFEALRGMGFRYLEQGDIDKAKPHLERAALIRPADPVVQEALHLLRTRMAEAASDATTQPVDVETRSDAGGESAAEPCADADPRPHAAAAAGGGQEGGSGQDDSPGAPPDDDAPVLELVEDDAVDILELGDTAPAPGEVNGAMPSIPLSASPRWSDEPTTRRADHAPARASRPAAEQHVEAAADHLGQSFAAGAAAEQQVAAGLEDAAGGEAADPTRLFDSMLEGPMLGVLLVDGQGLVLAGRLIGAAAAQSEVVGALIGGTADEAARVVEHLGLRAWKGMMLECGNAVVQLSPASDDATLVVVARRDSPRGWLARAANQAVALAEPLLGGT